MSIYKPSGEWVGSGDWWQNYNIRDEPLDEHFTDSFPDDDPEDLDLTQVGGKFVIGHNPTLRTQERLDPLLLNVWILGAVGLRKSEGDHGKPWHVVL